jgi:hypothetical protein
MAVVGLSEFSFGYGFLYEQTRRNWGNLRIAPILPNLVQEADAGWDARLPLAGTDFYYQFKLSDYLVRRNSKFHRDGSYHTPYYRIPFHPRDNNRQHHRLWHLAQTNPNTYYVAPEFATIHDFNSAFLTETLTEHSRLIPLNQCDDCTDAGQHYLTYQTGDVGWNQYSERKRREESYQGRELESLYKRTVGSWRRVDEAFAVDVFRKATDAVKRSFNFQQDVRAEVDQVLPLLDFDPTQERPAVTLLRTARVLSVFTGATMVLIWSPR